MVSFGRFRIVGVVRNRKAMFEVRIMPGNILFGVFPTKGDAAKAAIKLERAERATVKAIALTRKVGRFSLGVGSKVGKKLVAFIQSTDEFKSLTRRRKPRRKTKRRKKRRKT